MSPPPRSGSPRRLTVLQNTADDDERPRWQWVPIGAAFALSMWLPLAMVGTWLARLLTSRFVPGGALHETAEHLSRADAWERAALQAALVALPLLGFGLAVLAAGVLMGRFGQQVQPRDAVGSGVLAALLAAALTAWSAGIGAAVASLLLLLPDGALAGYLGGMLGVRLRRRSRTRAAPPAR